jgi:uncharacterized protein involved in propanediol utilization
MGSSTADVVAAIRAIADFHGVTLSREEEGRLAVLAECASDSIMIDDRVVLFAHRDGKVLETLGHQLPPMIVIGCDTDPGTQVDTLSLRAAEYDDQEIATFQILRGALRNAIRHQDVALLGKVATASARINQRYLPKPWLDQLLDLCRRHGGAGVQVAHSGTVAGLIFDARQPEAASQASACLAQIEEWGLTVTATIGLPRPGPVAGPVTSPATAAQAGGVVPTRVTA